MGMKARLLTPEDTLEVGDVLKQESWMGRKTYRIHRVTRTLAFIRYNENAEGSFPRDRIGNNGWVKPRGADTYSQVTWTAYRPVETPDA